jgi:NAD(P)-dependent dehydrogenase (short-subunit alcohol dehydrogenase family)
MDEYRVPWFHRAWTASKSWHRIRFGPISLLFRLARSGPRQRRFWMKRHLRKPQDHGSHETQRFEGRSPLRVERTLHAGQDGAPVGPVLIAGVGPRFGAAAAHYFSYRASGLAMLARSVDRLRMLSDETRGRLGPIAACACDLTDERQVRSAVQNAVKSIGVPSLFIYAAEGFCPGEVLTTHVAPFEESWRANCLGAFIVGQQIGRLMVARGHGTMVFMGGTSSLLARQGYLNLTVGKFGLRALSHVMARELAPSGVHVVHCVVDADISDGEVAEGPALNPEHLAAEILRLHLQPADCWTSELDLRPAAEKFWEHC